MEEDKGESFEGPIFRDIRRYFCEYCGICRSKKTLITSHILAHHQMEETLKGEKEEEEITSSNSNTCEECGAVFKKPAHLKQHMQSHSLERPFVCEVDDCRASYRRKDHLNRHLLQHQGKLFKCPIENCNAEFAFQANMKRHVHEFHEDDDSTSSEVPSHKQHICPEVGCGKVFEYASRLSKHMDAHVKLDSVETFCSEPGCMKYFTNEQYLKAHVQSCHQYIDCQICGTKYLKKNIKRHLRSHESEVASGEIKCSFKGCSHTFTTASNLHQHVKAFHEELKPFVCSISGCGKRFSYKHVRDRHEKSGVHVYVPGDFVESDEQFRSRPRGGRKRTFPTVEMLTRKRITPMEMDTMMDPKPTGDCPQQI